MHAELSWIEAIKAGDKRAFDRLYEAHAGRLYSLCVRFTRNAADAEEQLQEIFVRLLDKIDSFQGESSFGTWLHRLAVNHLINFNKARDRRPQLVAEPVSEPPATQSRPDLAMAIDKAVAQLPEGYRHVFILHDREGFKHDEIAQMLGCSPATSRSQLARARLALRKLLTPQEVAS